MALNLRKMLGSSMLKNARQMRAAGTAVAAYQDKGNYFSPLESQASQPKTINQSIEPDLTADQFGLINYFAPFRISLINFLYFNRPGPD